MRVLLQAEEWSQNSLYSGNHYIPKEIIAAGIKAGACSRCSDTDRASDLWNLSTETKLLLSKCIF